MDSDHLPTLEGLLLTEELPVRGRRGGVWIASIASRVEFALATVYFASISWRYARKARVERNHRDCD
jgi:hypothetical protein